MENTDEISKDFILCLERLLSAIINLHKYLPNEEKITNNYEESKKKLQIVKDAIISLEPAVKTASQFDSTSLLIEKLSNQYELLYQDFQRQNTFLWFKTHGFSQCKQILDELSRWLDTTSEILTHDDNSEHILLIVKAIDELNKYKVFYEQIQDYNHIMIDDFIDEQAKKINEEINYVKQQWKIVVDDLNSLKEKYSLPDVSSTNDHEYLIIYVEKWLTLSRQLLNDSQSLSSEQLVSQFKECEGELNRLKHLFDNITTSNIPQTLVDEMQQLILSLPKARIELENQIACRHQIESLEHWLKNFTEMSKHLDKKTIQLALNEKRKSFEEIIQSNQHCEQIENLIQMWNYFSSITTDSPSEVNTQSSSSSSRVNEQAQELLNTIVQLGNRQQVEQLKNKIKILLLDQNISLLSNRIYNELAKRQLILQQMLIDTTHIDHLRVNFVSHFNTENNVITAVNEINTLIENYPSEMTSQLRQWLNEQKKSTIINKETYMESFDAYLKELREAIEQYENNEANQNKFQKLVQLVENPPNVPENIINQDRQYFERFQSQYAKIKIEIEEIKKKNQLIKTNLDTTINNIDVLITHLRDIELQIQTNEKQPIQDYEKLLLDCQRIQIELNDHLRLSVEQAINTGKRLYAPSSRDATNGTDSADEIGSISPYSSLKKHSDLTLRKVRRHVLQLSQYWKNANNNIQSRLKVLQRLQTAVEDLRRKCDHLHSHLLEIELAYAHKPQIKSLTSQQIPAEIEQAKNLLTTLMSCKPSIDDVQQSAQSIENQYDIHMMNRAEELNHRWQHSVSIISQRIQSLQDSIRSTESNIYSGSVEPPWQRAIAENKIPYYINHSDQTTSWDHPKMLELMRSFAGFNDIRFSAYRTAMKLRTLQKRLCLDLTSLNTIVTVFQSSPIIDSVNKNIDVNEILDYLHKIFEYTANEYPQLVNLVLTIDLTLNWLLNIYDMNRTGSIRLISMKMALALLCRGNIEEKYRYIFSLVTYEHEGRSVIDRQRLSILFQQVIVIPKQLGEVAAFGGSSVEPSVQSCFEFAHNPEWITTEAFLEWVKLEPQSLVWLPVMHRLAASEAAKHEARCNICKIYPILGFRYRSLRYFNCDICQNCFFSGKQTKVFKMDHPLQEYYTETTSSEDVRDFFRIFKHKFLSKHRKSPKLGYLPLPHVFDNTLTMNESPMASASPLYIPSITTAAAAATVEPIKSSRTYDEHGVIAEHCRTLTHSAVSPIHLNRDQRNELEAIIHDLEDENRLLQQEYERLCQEHMEKSLIINEQHEQIEIQDREILREAKQLRQHKNKLEQRMKILEEHNQQLEEQLKRSKQLLLRQSPTHSTHRSSVERQNCNLHTIDNLFDMANDINRAVGDLVSVITEPQSNTSTSYPTDELVT